ncbi:MAG: potassium channel family protein [Ignavibacteria bacterium]
MKVLANIKFGIKYFSEVLFIISLILSSILLGTVGYILIENYSFLDALYMTVITVTTVGFREVRELSQGGRIFTIVLIITNIGLFFYGATKIVHLIIEGEFRNFFKYYSMTKSIAELKNHVIVCGYGRNGKQVCLELYDDKIPFVIIEKRPEIIDEIRDEGKYLFIEGDSTEESVLIEAGIKKAKALITTLPEDPDNVYVVLTARELNQNITIISRASVESSESKLKKAGANNVIMPEKIGGAHMAALVSKPDIIEFIAHLTGQGSDINITFEEIPLMDISDEYQNKTIKDLDVRNKTGANIIGLKLEDGKYIINPAPETPINIKAQIIILGNSQQIREFRELLCKSQNSC